MVYNILAVHVLRLELGVVLTSHVNVSLTGGFRGTPG